MRKPMTPDQMRADWPDLTRTEAALAALDASGEVAHLDGPAAEALRAAFADDTADRNDPELIRSDRSSGDWLRRLVGAWVREGRPGAQAADSVAGQAA